MMTPEEQSELIRIIQRAQLTISEAFWINALLERLKPQEPKKAETPQS